jgi:molybdate transport system substrate-binding protein
MLFSNTIRSTCWGLIFLCFGCNSNSRQVNGITIATAANMQFAMEVLTKKFTDQTGIECHLVVSSSGKLTAQIKEGAPFDIFVAANMKYPAEIQKSGLAQEVPRIYAYGKLVLWTMREGVQPDLKLLPESSIKRIAIANPKTAPYGQAAVEVLQHYDIYETVEDKLVFGESIAQTNQFITTQSADIGFTAMSVVLSPQMKGQGNWGELEAHSYSPIEQGVVLLKNKSTTSTFAQQFYDYLFSENAKEVLQGYGYSVKE